MGHTQVDRLVRKESQVLIRGILLHVRVSRVEQRNEHVDEDDGSQEVPRVVNDQSEWIPKTFGGRVKVWRAGV